MNHGLRQKTIYEDYGCEVNTLAVPQLFRIYEEAGFLYPAKRDLLAPHWERIIENWERALSSPDELMFVVSSKRTRGNSAATITSWRSAFRGWVTQHLVCLDNPLGSRAVMLATSAARTTASEDNSHQLWFRPDNKFPQRIFGSMVDGVGRENASISTNKYFAIPSSIHNSDSLSAEPACQVKRLERGNHNSFLALVDKTRGPVYVAAEELSDDPGLANIDELYRKVGLRRFREGHLAYLENHQAPLAASVCYRGPLGLNFSFLENRIEIVMSPSLGLAEIEQIISSLVTASLTSYETFEMDWIPIIAPDTCTKAIEKLGGRPVRDYSQGIWLRSGFWEWYKHVDSFYSKVAARSARAAELTRHEA